MVSNQWLHLWILPQASSPWESFSDAALAYQLLSLHRTLYQHTCPWSSVCHRHFLRRHLQMWPLFEYFSRSFYLFARFLVSKKVQCPYYFLAKIFDHKCPIQGNFAYFSHIGTLPANVSQICAIKNRPTLFERASLAWFARVKQIWRLEYLQLSMRFSCLPKYPFCSIFSLECQSFKPYDASLWEILQNTEQPKLIWPYYAQFVSNRHSGRESHGMRTF